MLVDRLCASVACRRTPSTHDEWAKDVAPSTELAPLVRARPGRFRRILPTLPAGTDQTACCRRDRPSASAGCSSALVLLTATRDVEHSGAAVLRSVIEHEAR